MEYRTVLCGDRVGGCLFSFFEVHLIGQQQPVFDMSPMESGGEGFIELVNYGLWEFFQYPAYLRYITYRTYQ